MEEKAKEKEIERQKKEQKEKERQEQLRKDEQNITSAVAAVLTANGLPVPAQGIPVPAINGTAETNPTQASTSNVNGTANESAPKTEAEPVKELTPEELEAKRKKEEREAKKAAEKARRLEEERLARKEAFEKQELEYAQQMADASAKYSVNPLGVDRIFRRFWLLSSMPGLFVEWDDKHLEDFDFTPVPQNSRSNPLLPFNTRPQGMPIIQPIVQMAPVQQQQQPQAQVVDEVKEHDTSNSSNKENIDIEMIGGNTPTQGGATPLTDQTKSQDVINGIIQPEPEVKIIAPELPDPCMLRQNHVRWAYYSTPEQVDQLIASLNPRGLRESALKETLLQEKKRITDSLKNIDVELLTSGGEILEGPDMASTPRQVVVKMNSGKKGLVSNKANGEESLELLLREQILYIEDRVWQGGLGYIKVNKTFCILLVYSIQICKCCQSRMTINLII